MHVEISQRERWLILVMTQCCRIFSSGTWQWNTSNVLWWNVLVHGSESTVWRGLICDAHEFYIYFVDLWLLSLYFMYFKLLKEDPRFTRLRPVVPIARFTTAAGKIRCFYFISVMMVWSECQQDASQRRSSAWEREEASSVQQTLQRASRWLWLRRGGSWWQSSIWTQVWVESAAWAGSPEGKHPKTSDDDHWRCVQTYQWDIFSVSSSIFIFYPPLKDHFKS